MSVCVLVREHRVARQARLLRALDLAVPVGALDQADHEMQPVPARHRGHLVDDGERRRLVGLHCQAEAAPLRELGRDAPGQCFQHVERKFEPVALFGVDRQVDVRARGRLDQAPHPRQQLGEYTLALRVLVAREQCAELQRDAVGLVWRRGHAPGCDGVDRVAVGSRDSARIAFGARAFAEHVVAEAQVRHRFALGRGLAHRLGDRAAEHELAPEQLQRAHGGRDHRLRAQRCNRPGGFSPSGRKRLDSAIALADRLANMRCGPSAVLTSKSARPSWSAVSAIAVSASGTRSSASASRISANPSAVEIGYSCSSDSIAQNGAGCARTPSTQGRAAATTAGQSSPLQARAESALTASASGRYGKRQPRARGRGGRGSGNGLLAHGETCSVG